MGQDALLTIYNEVTGITQQEKQETCEKRKNIRRILYEAKIVKNTTFGVGVRVKAANRRMNYTVSPIGKVLELDPNRLMVRVKWQTGFTNWERYGDIEMIKENDD